MACSIGSPPVLEPTGPVKRVSVDAFCVYGFCFRLRTNHRVARRLFSKLYTDFSESHPNGNFAEAVLEQRDSGFCWAIEEKSNTEPDLSKALWALEAALCETIIRSQPRFIAVHAASVVAGKSAALLAGRSGAGKSTLSIALGRRGLAVASDDVTLVDPQTLQVFPIPRCFHLDSQSVGLLQADGLCFPQAWRRWSFMAPSDFGVHRTLQCLAKTVIFVFGPRTETPRIVQISQAEMTARLFSETGLGPLDNVETLQVLSRLAAGACCYTLTPGPLSETADLVAELIQSRPGR
jgi:hypothetical protein